MYYVHFLSDCRGQLLPTSQLFSIIKQPQSGEGDAVDNTKTSSIHTLPYTGSIGRGVITAIIYYFNSL